MSQLRNRVLGGLLLLSLNTAYAQNYCSEYNFNDGNLNGWILSGGTEIEDYKVPTDCHTDPGGIITPGVGGNLPTRIISPLLISNGLNDIGLSFDIYRLNANLQCNSWSDYSCPTTVQLSIQKGDSTFTLFSNLVLPHNGPGYSPSVSIHFNVQDLLSSGEQYKLVVDFRKKLNTINCVQTNTKYIIDNIRICQQQPDGVIDAIDDNLCPYASTTNEFTGNLSSNDIHPAGSTPVYSLMNGPYGNNNSEAGGAVINMNTDGSFSISRTEPTLSKFDFTYRVSDASTGNSDMASCTVCFNEAGALPVELLSFEASRKNNMVNLNWKTGMESNLVSFDIQRKIKGVFSSIGTVQASNNATGSTYQFHEFNNEKAVSEYRIKIIDLLRNERYSIVKTVAGTDHKDDLLIYPNPSTGVAKIIFNESSENQSVDLIDYTGRLLNHYQKTQSNTINITGLKTGLYLIKITNHDSGAVSTHELIVK